MGAMNEVLQSAFTVVAALSVPVKAAWLVWLAWACAQLVWTLGRFQRPQTVEAGLNKSAAPPKSAARRPVAQRPTKPAAVSPYGESDFLAALDHEQSTDFTRHR